MNIRQLRERKKLRTVDVASRLDVGESTIRNWEKGRTIPRLRIDQFNDLLVLYDCTFDELWTAVKKSCEADKGEDRPIASSA
ncbi:MAG: helix-turn-helix domain-containing protein [Cyanomargarita calcarea GSE-NOS-MK-12-04C]|jgi:transcriptional regulator with XRE-family HTH domain|uniref:Helix-turn-helix domain-containing protein n=1 Tax=Cyanomargarita calcarea GSE-NOS-MK-12-04C TaxID=2839659 RepID=A0A951QNW7_9CYAN|nr:helix-turn-helix domain-containing protein [Cyanomargarita calcarea GSE-NOS-MK-12-04C]